MNPHTYSLYTRLKAPYLLGLLEPRGGELILDIGCGAGYFTANIGKSNARCYGIDLDLDSLRFAKGEAQAIFINGSATAIPFKDNAFEKVLLADVLEHVEDDEKVISELCRIAKDQAVIVISCPTGEGLLGGTRLSRVFHCKKGTPQYHFRDSYTLEDLKRLLQRHSIQVVEVRYSGILLGEVFMEALKLVLFLIKKDYTSQASIRDIDSSFFFKLYCHLVFPFIYGIARIEDLLLSRFIKGHTIIIKGVVKKGT